MQQITKAAQLPAMPGTDRQTDMLARLVCWTPSDPATPMELSRSLTVSERQLVERRVATLDASLDARDGRMLERAVTAMLMGFPSGRAAGEEAEMVIAAYVNVLRDMPPWAVNEAARRWATGKADPFANLAFAPSAAQVHEVAQKVLVSIRAETHSLRRLLAAVQAPPVKAIAGGNRHVDKAAEQATQARTSLEKRAAEMGLDAKAALAEIPNREHSLGDFAQLKAMIG